MSTASAPVAAGNATAAVALDAAALDADAEAEAAVSVVFAVAPRARSFVTAIPPPTTSKIAGASTHFGKPRPTFGICGNPGLPPNAAGAANPGCAPNDG